MRVKLVKTTTYNTWWCNMVQQEYIHSSNSNNSDVAAAAAAINGTYVQNNNNNNNLRIHKYRQVVFGLGMAHYLWYTAAQNVQNVCTNASGTY